jgi:hypothetical protein
LYNIRATKREKERVSVGIAARVDVLELCTLKKEKFFRSFSQSHSLFSLQGLNARRKEIDGCHSLLRMV